jgi:hypothetical protein
LPHSLNNANSEIVFSSPNALLGRWLVARRVWLNRDWSWDGLLAEGLRFEAVAGGPTGTPSEPASNRPSTPDQTTQVLSHLRLPFVVGQRAGRDAGAQGDHTTFILWDAVEAADPDEGGTSADITLVWRVCARLAGAAGPCDWVSPHRTLHLPAPRANVQFFTQAFF